eukprot:m.342166 g.342166  ORF g.342166 m.342166 type:complete len:378 (+) comp21041_c0_seq1:78-1211(+)
MDQFGPNTTTTTEATESTSWINDNPLIFVLVVLLASTILVICCFSCRCRGFYYRSFQCCFATDCGPNWWKKWKLKIGCLLCLSGSTWRVHEPKNYFWPNGNKAKRKFPLFSLLFACTIQVLLFVDSVTNDIKPMLFVFAGLAVFGKLHCQTLGLIKGSSVVFKPSKTPEFIWMKKADPEETEHPETKKLTCAAILEFFLIVAVIFLTTKPYNGVCKTLLTMLQLVLQTWNWEVDGKQKEFPNIIPKCSKCCKQPQQPQPQPRLPSQPQLQQPQPHDAPTPNLNAPASSSASATPSSDEGSSGDDTSDEAEDICITEGVVVTTPETSTVGVSSQPASGSNSGVRSSDRIREKYKKYGRPDYRDGATRSKPPKIHNDLL